MNNYYPTCDSFFRMKIAISYMQIFKTHAVKNNVKVYNIQLPIKIMNI